VVVVEDVDVVVVEDVDVVVVEDAMYALAIVPWSVCRSARA
jgi:hypothetical protein